MNRAAKNTAPGRLVELRIPNELGWERVAIDVAASIAERMGFPPERIEDIKTAVSEATTNAIEHGNLFDRTKMVSIVLAPGPQKLEIMIRDASIVPFGEDDSLGTPPDLKQILAGKGKVRGWGIFLIKSLVDEAEFTSTDEGNVVRMVVYLQR
jgi:serine/threonine-protein kinase RsbW